MKSMYKIFSLIVLSTTVLTAKGQAYENAMQKGLQQFGEAETSEEYQNVANHFERISNMNSDEWLPYYYAALTYVTMNWNLEDGDDKDAVLDKAESLIEKAEKISENNAELVLMMGYIKMAKLSVSPALRGPFMTPKVNALFAQAVQMEPENPRAHGLKARMEYGTASFFGSGTEKPCEEAQKALELYAKEEQTERGIQPAWGKNIAQGLVKACSKK